MRFPLRALSTGALLAALTSTASAQFCLSTLFAGGNGLGVNSSVFFDVTVNASILVSRFEMNYSGAANVACGLEVWTTPTTYVGNTANPGVWTQVGIDNGLAVTAGANQRTIVDLASSFLLAPGTYGMCLVHRGAGSSYTNGNGTNQAYSDSFLSLALGQSQSGFFSGSPIANRVWNGSICYTPANGLFANFTGTPTSGPTPLTVNFTDTTFTSDPAGVQTWAWDLDGDTIVDSNAQNPSFTYNRCGPYNVTLTVTDTQNPSSTLTKSGFVFADPQLVVNANFVASRIAGIAPMTVQFTDTSAGSPTSWLWDLDGDNIPDSAAQNPSFTYSIPGIYTVSLSAGNGCFTDTETKVGYLRVSGQGANNPADVLCYQMNELRGTRVANVATGGAFPAFGTLPNTGWQRDPGAGRDAFDANEAGFGCLAQTPSATPSRNWINTGAPITVPVGGNLTLMWWARRDPSSTVASPFGYFFGDGSFRCFMGSAGILFGGGTGTTLSTTYTANFQGHLQQGVWNHYALVIDNTNGLNIIYENGVPHASPRSFTPGSYTYNPSALFAIGAISTGGGSPGTAHFDIDDFRIYASALSLGDIIASLGNETASNGAFDLGCPGPVGTPLLSAPQRPRLPNPTYTLDAANLEPGRPAAMIFGTLADLGGLLPLDLSAALGAGCALGVFPEVSFPFFSGAGGFSLPLGLPADPTLNGAHGYVQVVVVGTSGAISNALDVNLQIH